MTEPTDDEFVLSLSDRLRLYAKLYGHVEIRLTAESARKLADDLERGIAHRPKEAGAAPPQPAPRPTFLKRVADFLQIGG
jgi:hypothetical protein